MPYENGAHPGATWQRIDAQCHSPRDAGWQGSPHIPGGTPEHERARQDWANRFVKAAKDKGLHIVAITDHHDVAFLPYVLAAVADLGEQSNFYALPGIEITCKDNVQCLVIFDPNTDRIIWDRFLSKLPNVQVSSDEDSQIAQVQQCGWTIDVLFTQISSDLLLRENVLIIPHFGREDDHKSLNANGHAARARSLKCDGVYIECAFDALDIGTRDKIQGRALDWGDQRRAILATGDNKRATWDRLGAHECWIKLGEISLEGIRQAFLADEARITYSNPETPSEIIKEITVYSLLTGENPVRITFNAGFTAVIGGRGSGKSSLLEYLRFGLGKAEADLKSEEPDGRSRRARERKLIETTLVNGWVQLVIEREGTEETWRRTGDKSEVITVTRPDGSYEELSIASAQQRFPARAFHQKELSTTMVVPESASDNITGIAAAEFVEERRKADLEILNSKREVTTALQGLAGHWQAEHELAQAKAVVSDYKRRIEALAEKLQEGGVQHEDLEILADAPRYGRAENLLEDLEKKLEADCKALADLSASVLSFDESRYADALSFVDLEHLRNKVVEGREKILENLQNGKSVIDGINKTVKSAKINFKTEFTRYQTIYAAAKERQTAHSALILDNEKLTVSLKAAEASVAQATVIEITKRSAISNFSAATQKLNAVVQGRIEILKRAAEQVEGQSDLSLKARVKKDQQPKEYINSLCSIFDGSRFRDPELHCTEWVTDLLKVGGSGWPSLCNMLHDIYKAKIMSGNAAEPSTEVSEKIRILFSAGKSQITLGMVAKIYANLTDQTVGVVLSAVPKHSISLTYVSDGQSIRFDEASPGQQASALLRLLLRQQAGTLIIDQPEDDLDNRVLMDVVTLIRSSKSKRQIIFATHNPNLVVNGDADKVITMVATVPEDRAGPSVPRIRVQCDGAIETASVRASITTIMEGGPAAFELRAKKYGHEINATT